MIVKTATNRFITSSLRAGFYQQLLKSGFNELGCQLVLEAETAHAFRQGPRVEEIISILCNLPIREHQLIGQYYKGLRAERVGENTKHVFERVAEESRTYKTKALMSLARMEARSGNLDEELRYFKEASKTASNPSLIVDVSRGIAIVRAKEEDHKQAVKEFETILPLVKYVAPISYYQFLNSFAVELIEVGRLEEACNMSNIVLASPYAFAYPEWRETREDMVFRGYRSRSVISFSKAPFNVVQLPERSSERKSVNKPGKILSYTDWKKKMVKEPNGDKTDDTPLDEMTNKDLIIEIVQRASNKDMSEKKLRKILEYVMEVESEPED